MKRKKKSEKHNVLSAEGSIDLIEGRQKKKRTGHLAQLERLHLDHLVLYLPLPLTLPM